MFTNSHQQECVSKTFRRQSLPRLRIYLTLIEVEISWNFKKEIIPHK